MEWEKWTAMMEMAVLAKDGFEVRTLLRVKPLVIQPREPIYELEITGETKAKKRNPDIRNQEKKEFVNEDLFATISLGTKQMQRWEILSSYV